MSLVDLVCAVQGEITRAVQTPSSIFDAVSRGENRGRNMSLILCIELIAETSSVSVLV